MQKHGVFPDDLDRFTERQFLAFQKYVQECEQRDHQAAQAMMGGQGG